MVSSQLPGVALLCPMEQWVHVSHHSAGMWVFYCVFALLVGSSEAQCEVLPEIL